MSVDNTRLIRGARKGIAPAHLVPAQGLDGSRLCACELQVEPGPAGDIAVVRVAGEIDILTIPAVEAALAEAMARTPADVVLDLSAVGFCCVRGFALLARFVQTTQENGVGCAVSGLSPHLDRVATILWSQQHCVRYRSTAAAVTAMRIDQTYRSAWHA